ncbi:hypothetical protein FS749_004685 [Ceratobasidium sp. UAMH 11750]|nr:hypothetical protein FS749_004685 [Ceratobasidium sp. UAMH 11750]
MLDLRNQELDALLKARVAEDRYAPWRRRYSQSPSLPFFAISSLYNCFRCYDPPAQMRPLAEPDKIRLVCVSDTHNRLLPPSYVLLGDIFIHAGDLTKSGTATELMRTLDWIRSLPHAHKIVIAGNHDTALAQPEELNRLDFTGITYLCDKAVGLIIRDRKLRVYGSPWTPRSGNFAFQYPKESGAKRWKSLPEETGVLVTHGPPHAHCDRDGLGCEYLLQRLWEIRPKIMICGHIHAGRGVEQLEWDRVQQLWESAVRKRKEVGWWDVVVTTLALIRGWVERLGSKGDRSVVVNCAVVGGVRDQLVRDAVVIDI